jgi:ABC-type Fe3+/spermidine/putrescine transport system ATPase subunit
VFQRRIGLVFQDYALFPHMTVAANIDYGMRQQGIAGAERVERRQKLIELVRLVGLEGRKPGALSGGQQQRVALARALAISPRLLLLDEPLSNLDAKLREALRAELRDILRSLGMTTLVVTHDQLEAIGLADRIAVMRGGRIVQIGTPREIYEQPANRFVAEFIGQSIWFDGEIMPPGGAGMASFRTVDGLVLKVVQPSLVAERVGLLVRPESIEFGTLTGNANCISARIERVGFYGAETLVHCALDPSGRSIAFPMRNGTSKLPVTGERVFIGIAPESCRVVAQD